MAMAVADPIARLVKELARLPGIGEKSAQRLAFHILKAGPGYASDLAAAVTGVVRDVRLCSSCQTLTDRDPCAICADPERDPRTICVVEGVPDLVAVERTREYRGRYHVLHGALSPLDGA
jgi:recombination protein RecR